MSESTANKTGEGLQTLGRVFVNYCRKNATAPSMEEFESFLGSQGISAKVSLIYRLEAGDDVYYSDRLQSSSIYWRVRWDERNLLLPRPVSAEQFSDTKDFNVSPTQQVLLTPDSLGECVPTILGPLRDDWEMKTQGFLKAGEPPAFSQSKLKARPDATAGTGSYLQPKGNEPESGARKANLASEQVARAYVSFCAEVCSGKQPADINSLCWWIGHHLVIQNITREEVRYGEIRTGEHGFWPCSLFEYPQPEPDAWLFAWSDAAQKWQGLLLPVIKSKSRFSQPGAAFVPHSQRPDSLLWIKPATVTQQANYAWALTNPGSLEGLPAELQADLTRCYRGFRTQPGRAQVTTQDFIRWVTRWYLENSDAQKRLAGENPVVLSAGNSGMSEAILEVIDLGNEAYWLLGSNKLKIWALFPAFTNRLQNLEGSKEVFNVVVAESELPATEECTPAYVGFLTNEAPVFLEVIQKGVIVAGPDRREHNKESLWKRICSRFT